MATDEIKSECVGKEGENAKEAAFRERLAELAKQHSVRGLARHLDIPGPNISRYIRKGPPAAAFCRRLVERLGVNPAWLLTGEGSSMLSDVPMEASNTASNLLELVEAMSAVTRMRLGALTGKQHAQVLRELNNALVRYEELRRKLNRYSESTFRDIIGNLKTILKRERDADRAQPLIKAGEQISRLCDDQKLCLDYKRLRSLYEYLRGNHDESIRIFREYAFHDFILTDDLHESSVNDIRRFASQLDQQFRLKKAQTIAEAGLIFAVQRGEDWLPYVHLLWAAALLDFELGNMTRACERMIYVHSCVEEHWREHYIAPILARVHFYAGIVNYKQARDVCGKIPTPTFLSPLVIWSEQEYDLADNLKKLMAYRGPENQRIDLYGAMIKSLLDAKHGVKAPEAIKRLTARLPDMPASDVYRIYLQPVCMAQIAVLGRNQRLAKHLVTEVNTTLERAKPDIQIPVMWAAIHYRNILRTPDMARKLRDKAQNFFNQHIQAGYGAFKSMLEPVS